MSKEQLVEQQPGQETGGSANEGQDQTYGLRADLYAQIQRMSPADADQLAAMLVNYPRLGGQILPVASHHMGNAAVRRAIALAKQIKASSSPGSSLSQGEVHEALDDPMDSRTVPWIELASTLEDKSDPQAPDETPSKSKEAPTPEPGWVAAARTYNAAHADLVEEFNDLTAHICLNDDTVQLDPQAVASWQTQHGLTADGKVGPRTVAAARAARSKGVPVAQAEQSDARIPV